MTQKTCTHNLLVIVCLNYVNIFTYLVAIVNPRHVMAGSRTQGRAQARHMTGAELRRASALFSFPASHVIAN